MTLLLFFPISVSDTGRELRVQSAFFDIVTYNYKVAFTQNFTDGNFTYDPVDVIQSSVAGWLDYGYKYALHASILIPLLTLPYQLHPCQPKFRSFPRRPGLCREL